MLFLANRLRQMMSMSHHLTIQPGQRLFRTTSINLLKEIKISKKDANTIVIEGVKVTSPRAGKVVPSPSSTSECESCPLCRLNLTRLSYTDVLILNQFIESNGKLMSAAESGLCFRQYGKVKHLVRQAQKCQLLPRPSDYEVFGPWDSLNTYIDVMKRKRDQPMEIIKPEYWR